MTITLPRLDTESSRRLITRARETSLAELASELPNRQVVVTYSVVGGARIGDEDLSDVREAVLTLARAHGYPGSTAQLQQFDGECARLLHERLPMSAHEASHDDAWSYLTCCWLLDIAVWRFGPTADERRFLGNVNRNTFRRLWWRSEVIGQDTDLAALGEDELVNIMERPTIAGDRRLARAIVSEFLARVDAGIPVDRMQLMREAMKRLLRLAPFVSFQALGPAQLEQVVSEAFEAAAAALAGRVHAPVLPPPVAAQEASPEVMAVPAFASANVEGLPSSNGSGQEADRAALGELALDIARRTGRVTNMTLREVASLDSEEARAVFEHLMAEGRLVRRGYKRGTHYVLPEPADSAAEPGDRDSALRRLLRRGAD